MKTPEDLLFCKIAIQSGLLTEEGAKRGLALASKLEAEGKPRPKIGALLVKINLLSPQNAQRIYGAIQKRLAAQGAPAAPARRTAGAKAGGGEAGLAARTGRLHGEDRAARRKAIDPTTLWLGIGSGVVFVIAVIIMLVLVLNDARRREQQLASRTPSPAESSSGLGLSGQEQKSGNLSKRNDDLSQPLPVEVREALEKEVKTLLNHARAALRSDNNLSEAFHILLTLKKEKRHQLEKIPELKDEINATIDETVSSTRTQIQEAGKLLDDGKKDDAAPYNDRFKDLVDAKAVELRKELLEAPIAEQLLADLNKIIQKFEAAPASSPAPAEGAAGSPSGEKPTGQPADQPKPAEEEKKPAEGQ
ncbi:MAG: hypothetical protein HY717_18255 [Planctomycetes bacterium]|nr:hypothetical protein [Planctomycetota bacterium]